MKSIKKLSILVIVLVFTFPSLAQNVPQASPNGWSALLLNNVTLQQGSEAALRNRPSPFRPDLVVDEGGRFVNFFNVQLKQDAWTFAGAIADNRTIGGGAYSLTNPISFGVNTIETTGTRRKVVDYKSGIQELTASYKTQNTSLTIGKIDTANWYLVDPIFGGDLLNGNDFGNSATRVVAPPFPSIALVLKHDYGNGFSLTGIAGDAFGDRETLSAARNLVKGDLAYVVELNYQTPKLHYQLSVNHVDAFRFYDKDAVWPGPGEKAAKVDAVIATASYRLNRSWAGFARVGYASGRMQTEDLNYLIGVRYDSGKFYALISQSATRISTDNTPYKRGAKGDYTWVSEVTLNYKLHPQITLGLTYDYYHSDGNSLLAKDGGWNGSKKNQIIGARITSVLGF